MATVHRETLLSQLESCKSGLAPKEIAQQSSCFVFENGYVRTYNDEVACKIKTNLDKAFTAAVPAAPLLAILTKMSEEEVEITPSKEELLLSGKKRKAGIRMEEEIFLDTKLLDAPGEWIPLDPEFCEALDMVRKCAGKDEDKFYITCVHIHPKWVEATNNLHLARYRLKTHFPKPILIKKVSVKEIAAMEMTDFSVTESWVHFRSGNGMIMSCRYSEAETFPDLGSILKAEGHPTTLPKGLPEAIEKAGVFSEDNAEDKHIRVQLRHGKLRIKGEGASGWYTEFKKLVYDGEPLDFYIEPELFSDLAKNHNECEVTKDLLKVVSGKFTYISCLENGDDTKDEQEDE